MMVVMMMMMRMMRIFWLSLIGGSFPVDTKKPSRVSLIETPLGKPFAKGRWLFLRDESYIHKLSY